MTFTPATTPRFRNSALPGSGSQTQPGVRWDGTTWFVTLPVQDGQVIDAKWEPGLTYVVRIREKGAAEWSFGFETPVTGCTFTDLKPDTEYEVQVRTKTARGEGAPTFTSIRTNPAGGTSNIIPFPRR